MPVPLTKWAIALRDHINDGFAYGQTWTTTYDDQIVLARRDRHSWTYKGGVLVQNICIPGITLYTPTSIASAAPAGNVQTAGTGLVPHGLGADTLVPNPSAGPAVAPDQTPPDPNLAVFSAAPTDWGLVALSAGAGAAVVGLFLLALRHAGARRGS